MRVFLFVVVFALAACGGSSDDVDAGSGDAGTDDSGVVDAGRGDAGEDGGVIRDPYPHACTYARDLEADGRYDWVSVYELDDEGRVLRDETDSDGDHAVNYVTVFTYDDEGRVLKRELDEDNDGEIDVEYTTEYRDDGQIERTIDYDAAGEMIAGLDYVYDDDGFLIELLGDLAGEDTHGHDSRMTFENDENGCVIASTLDRFNDGQIEESTTRVVDDACRQLELASDRFDDGTVDFLRVVTYDDDGHELTATHTEGGEVTLERTTSWENGLKQEQVDEHGTSRDVITWQYDEAGNLIRIDDDKFDDGMAVSITKLEVDSRGNVLYEFIDDRGDGHPDDMAAYTYDCWE